jgi:hypothetical protein
VLAKRARPSFSEASTFSPHMPGGSIEYLGLGANVYLPKPFERKERRLAIENLLQGSSLFNNPPNTTHQ